MFFAKSLLCFLMSIASVESHLGEYYGMEAEFPNMTPAPARGEEDYKSSSSATPAEEPQSRPRGSDESIGDNNNQSFWEGVNKEYFAREALPYLNELLDKLEQDNTNGTNPEIAIRRVHEEAETTKNKINALSSSFFEDDLEKVKKNVIDLIDETVQNKVHGLWQRRFDPNFAQEFPDRAPRFGEGRKDGESSPSLTDRESKDDNQKDHKLIPDWLFGNEDGELPASGLEDRHNGAREKEEEGTEPSGPSKPHPPPPTDSESSVGDNNKQKEDDGDNVWAKTEAWGYVNKLMDNLQKIKTNGTNLKRAISRVYEEAETTKKEIQAVFSEFFAGDKKPNDVKENIVMERFMNFIDDMVKEMVGQLSHYRSPSYLAPPPPSPVAATSSDELEQSIGDNNNNDYRIGDSEGRTVADSLPTETPSSDWETKNPDPLFQEETQTPSIATLSAELVKPSSATSSKPPPTPPTGSESKDEDSWKTVIRPYIHGLLDNLRKKTNGTWNPINYPETPSDLATENPDLSPSSSGGEEEDPKSLSPKPPSDSSTGNAETRISDASASTGTALVIVGVVCGLMAVAAIIFFVVSRKRKQKNQPSGVE